MVSELLLKSKINTGLNIKISRMKEIIKATRPHGHKNYFEIIFLTQGAGWHYIDLQKYPVNPNSIFFIQPGQIHCWEFTEIPKGFVLMFRYDFLLQHHIDQSHLINLSYFINGFAIPTDEAGEISALLENILKEYKNDSNPDGESIAAAYLRIISLKLKRFIHPTNASFLFSPSEKFKLFKKALDENIIEKRQVQDYADMLHITPKYLNDICQKTVNRTASDLVHEKLILEAKKLLLHTNKKISEIAFQLKFHDSSHFAKFFRKYAGVSPKIFTESMK